METVITKTIICSGVLLGLYYLFLAKEKTLIFNRFYLIFSLVFSICIPFLTIERPQPEEKTEIIFAQETTEQVIINQPDKEQIFDLSQLILLIYLAVATLFLAKFVYSLIKIKTLKGQKTIYKSRKVFLLKKDLAPFSFWNTIYVSRKDFMNEEINHNIFLHEEIHIRQKHSVDVLLTELLKIIFWFNPFIYFYKKAIISNHEFLADEGVIQQNKNIKTYQELILNEILKQQNPALVDPFNFNNTKNRFIMMTKQNSKFGKAKRFLAIPVFAIATFAFAEKVYGSENPENRIFKSDNLTFSKNPVQEFLDMSEKYKDIIQARKFERFQNEVPTAEKKKFMELFNQIDIKDRNKIPFWIHYDEIVKQLPTSKQLLQFQDSKYNISINNKNVDNTVLKNYKNTDFFSVYVLKIQPQHENYGKYAYGVVLYTNEFAKKHNAEKKMQISFTMNQQELKSSLKSDTIRPQKTLEAKVTDVKSEKNNEKTVTDVAVATAVLDQGQEKTPAEFPGGMNDFRRSVGETFNHVPFENKIGTVSTIILISIDENGKTTDVKTSGDDATFNSEAARTVRLVTNNKTWKPATENGKPVKSVFKLPLKIQFANPVPAKTQ